MRDMSLRGMREVFSFALRQYMKSKSTIISMVIMLFASCGALIIGSLNYSSAEPVSAIRTAYIDSGDITAADITAADIAAVSPMFAGLVGGGEDSDARVEISIANGAYVVTASANAENISDGELASLEDAAVAALNSALARRSGASGTVGETRLVTESEYLSPKAEEEDDSFSEGRFAVSYAYSIIVMMLVLFTTAYIIRAIIEEKDSKLVEFLMVSVSPLSLITGKILAAMCVVLIELGALALGGAGAFLISKYALDSTAINAMLSSMGVLEALSNLNIFTAISIVISIVLGFLTFSIMGGVLGACCTTIDDTNSATLILTGVTLAGYLGSVFVMMFGGTGISIFSALCPVLCVFCAPIRYAIGDISALTLLLSWALQAAQVALLFLFCARVYGALIMYRGARIKLRGLLRIARKEARTNV